MKTIDCNKAYTCESKGWGCRVFHKEHDAAGIFRLLIYNDNWEVELLPSKGFSVGQVHFRNHPLFWEAPISLIDPDRLDLHDDSVRVNGEPAPGFSFLKTFASGIELYGLRNWGMPFKDPDSGQLFPLHGESSNIPVQEASLELLEDHALVSASFDYRNYKGHSGSLWYLAGRKLFKVTRNLKIPRDRGKLEITDHIHNLSDNPQLPDWGYHITFRPEKGDQLMLPSRKRAYRDGGTDPGQVETWLPAAKKSIRSETGVLHKGLKVFESKTGPCGASSRALFKFKDKRGPLQGLLLSFPVSPYTQSWSCAGGAGSREFTLSNGRPLFQKSWNGLGLEIGASALDHDGNTDPKVSYEGRLQPGESLVISLGLEVLETNESEKLEKEICAYIDRK